MTMEQAEELGFTFTGASWSKWDSDREARYKAKAAELKKKYKGVDFRIVSGTAHGWLGRDSKAIMGNSAYIKVQYFKEEAKAEWLGDYEHRKEAAKLEYEQKLAELEKEYLEELAEFNEIAAMKKK